MATDGLGQKLQDKDTFRLLIVLFLTLIYPVFAVSFFALYVTVLVPVLVESNYECRSCCCHAYWVVVSLLWIILCAVVLPLFQDSGKAFSVQDPGFRPDAESYGMEDAAVWKGPNQDTVARCSEPEKSQREPTARLHSEFEVILESGKRMRELDILEEAAEVTDEEGETNSEKLECPSLPHGILENEHVTGTEAENDPHATKDSEESKDENESNEALNDTEVTETHHSLMEDDVVNEEENKTKIVEENEGVNEAEVETVSQAHAKSKRATALF